MDLDENEQCQVASELLETGRAFFLTAWSSPLQAIAALSRMLPADTLILDYLESGMFFGGRATFNAGHCANQGTCQKRVVIRIAR